MSDLSPYFELLSAFQNDEKAIDVAHNVLLIGSLLSKKPYEILELGIGTSFITRSLIAAVRFNQRGAHNVS